MGYHRAGFDVVGVDHQPQPNYPFRFIHADVLSFDWRAFNPAALAGSPPCQPHSVLKHFAGDDKIDILPQVREIFQNSGLPYIIENVPGAPMINPVVLCGTEFGLKAIDQDGRERHLRRHRLFESNVLLKRRDDCDRCLGSQSKLIGGCYGGGGGGPNVREDKKGRVRAGYQFDAGPARAVMGTPWMTRDECGQAVPPAYTEHLGRQLLPWVLYRSEDFR